MFSSLLPSRAGFALALAVLLIPIAVGLATTASGDGNGDDRPPGNTFNANTLFADPTGIAFLARPWCRNSSRGAFGTVICQTTKP